MLLSLSHVGFGDQSTHVLTIVSENTERAINEQEKMKARGNVIKNIRAQELVMHKETTQEVYQMDVQDAAFFMVRLKKEVYVCTTTRDVRRFRLPWTKYKDVLKKAIMVCIKALRVGIGVNVGNSKLMQLGINLLLLEKVNVVRRNLLLLVVKVQKYQPIPIIQPSTSQPQKKQSRRKQRRDTKIPQSSGPIEHLADEVANEELVPTQSNDPPLLRVNTLGSGEDRLSLKELMDLCTKLSDSVLDLETTKTAQANEIASLKKRVKKLEGKRKSKPPWMKRLFKIGRSAQVVSSEDEGLEVTLVDESQGRNDKEMFDIGILDGEEVFAERDVVEKEVIAAGPVTTAGEVVTTASATTTIVNELTLAQTLIEIKAAKPKVRGVMIQEPSETTTPAASKPSQDKGKAKMTESEKPLRKKDQIMLAREQEKEANIALTESWDNTQAMMDTNRLFAEILQAREQEELTDEEKARLFVELLEKRKKHFAALRAQEKKNKPPTKAQKKSTMLTYLKHMSGYKQSYMKNKSFAEIQKLFDKAMTWVNMFVDMDTELVRESLKKDEAQMAQESSFKREGVDGSSKTYSTVIHMLKNFDREDLETLWKIVKARHGYTRPEEGYETVLWGDLKTMFEHHVKDLVWRHLMKKLDDFEDKYQVYGRIFEIKRLHDDLKVKTAQLVLLVQSYNCFFRVNYAGTKLQLLKDYNCSRIKTAEKIKIDWRSRILT
ncbi:hypothetical protein Tco_0784417 [Tanacetum coccineum]